jgi:hypothetical protein
MFIAAALAVCIFQTKYKLAAIVAGKKPVEQSGSGPAQMQSAGGRGRKTGYHLGGHGRPFCLGQWLELWTMVFILPYNRNFAEFNHIWRNWTAQARDELRQNYQPISVDTQSPCSFAKANF